MSDDHSGSEGAERCGVETSDGTPCKNPAGSCRWHDAEGADSSTEESHAIPTEEKFYEDHTTFLSTLMGTEEAWDGKSLKTTVAVQAIRKHSQSASEKAELYGEMFGICPVDGCQQGQNGFEADYCSDHQDEYPDEDDSSDDEGSMTVVIDGKEVSGDKETIQALLDQ